MKRILVPALAGALAAGLFFMVIRLTGPACRILGGCQPTEIEQQVDSTLATVPAWQDSVRAKDSVIAIRGRERDRERRLRLAERARADSAEAKARAMQAVADSLAQIPEGTASDSVAHLLPALAAQKKAAVQFELLADSLKAHRSADSARIMMANETISQLIQWRGEDQRRINTLTVQLGNLRETTKHAGDWNLPLGIHLPGWTKCVALGALGAGAGALVDHARGAAIGGGSAAVGCLAG